MLGEGAGQVPCDDAHLVVRAMRRTCDLVGDAPPGIRMRCRNAHPARPRAGQLGRRGGGRCGGGVALSGRDMELEQETLLQVTAGIEGHADNAAASLLGGFTVAWETGGNFSKRFHAVRLDVHPGIQPVVLVAGDGVVDQHHPRAAARPGTAGDAAFTGSRTALAVLALTQRPDLLLRPRRTGCTSSTGARPSRSRPNCWMPCVSGVYRRPSPAPGRPCSP